MNKTNPSSLLAAVALLLIIALLPANQVRVVEAASACQSSAPSSGAYTVTVCITAPSGGTPLSGAVTTTATVSVTGTSPGVQRMVFYLNNAYLLTDYQSPYSFSLPTFKWMDGTYSLSVEALMRDSFVTQRPVQSVKFSNGIVTPPVNTNSFTPSSGNNPGASPFVVVATGDGASGEANAGKVTSLISTASPNLFLYLGDVYEKGMPAEFYNWYGNGGAFYNKFYSITNPTIGNHEYENGVAPGYFDYWNNIPNYYSYNAGGWHFVSLNSNTAFVPATTTSPQYKWLAQDLANNASACTIVYYHHPLFNIGPAGATTSMSAIWSLMAQNQVTIVLNGHDHDYQRWVPLDGSGSPSSTGITEFVAGGGGHGLQTISKTDSRVAYSNSSNPTALGALQLSLTATAATFHYMSINGTILDQGTIPCQGGQTQPDTQAPSVPGGLSATAASSTQVNLSWQASTDNVGVAGYTIYRGGTALSTVSGSTLSYADTTAQPNTTYSYTVDAFDQAGNHSGQSAPASVTTPGSSGDTQAPSVPTGLSATTASSTQVNLSWQASTDNVGVAGYTIYLGSAALGTVSGSTLSYSDTTAQPNTTYSYTVDAFDQAGNHSAMSSPASVTTPGSGGSTSITFNPTADSYVNAGSTTSNYGTSTTLRADGSPDVHSYLRFSVSGLGGKTITRARLLIFANSSLSAGVNALTVADNTWTETGVTYINAPPLGSQIATSGAISTGTWITLDVTSYITGEGTYSIGVNTLSSTAVSLASRESGANAPQLILDLQ